MYAIVEIAGKQQKVEKSQELYVNRLDGDEGTSVKFDQVYLIDNDGKVKVGSPMLKGAHVNATIVSHLKGNKILVFKKKRRKGYQKLNGHRQYLSLIRIDDILEKAPAKKAVKKETAVEEPKNEVITESKTEKTENKE